MQNVIALFISSKIPSYFCISSSYCAISSISESILQSILTCLNDFLCSKESFSSPCFEQKVGFNTYVHKFNKMAIPFRNVSFIFNLSQLALPEVLYVCNHFLEILDRFCILQEGTEDVNYSKSHGFCLWPSEKDIVENICSLTHRLCSTFISVL